MTITDFTLPNARRFYSLIGNHLSVKGLNYVFLFYQRKILLPQLLVTFQLWEMTDNSTISSTPAGAALVLQGFSYFKYIVALSELCNDDTNFLRLVAIR